MNWKRCLRAISISLAVCLLPALSIADEAKPPPSDGPAADAPRSRLTLTGLYTTDSYLQKNFFLGAGGDTTSGLSSDFDAYWTQGLRLHPRLILADNLNVNLALDLAQSIWGLDDERADTDRSGYASLYNNKGTFAHLHVDWAYLAYQHRSSKTRWYLGRQKFSLGNEIVLDEDADGIQIYRDFPSWRASLGFGAAKQSESVDGFSDSRVIRADSTGHDSRDADLFYVEWTRQTDRMRINPFYVHYIDRSNADRATYLPNGLGSTGARFHPNISRADVIGLSLAMRLGVLQIDIEYDQLSGADYVPSTDFGPDGLVDVNNGDLSGSNTYAKFALVGSRFELGGIYAKGSGDDNVGSGDGNINRIRTDGHFFITEVWEDSIMPEERGLNPDGLGSPLSRGYREFENTQIYQGFLAFRPRHNIRVFGSVSMIRAVHAIRPWSDANGDGILSLDELGPLPSSELGSEFDWRLDWTIERKINLALRGGIFIPRAAAGYLINGNANFQESAMEMRLSVSVPIPEFSLGG